MLKISPVAEFLRANKAKAKNIEFYNSGYPFFKSMKSCEFFDPDGKYLATMKTHTNRFNKRYGSNYAYQEAYLTTFENNGRVCREQQINQYGIYAKIKGKDGEADKFVPEKLKKEYMFKDEKGNIFKETWERVISSKLKPLEKEPQKDYNVYEALEPIKYTETYLGKTEVEPITIYR